MRSQANNDHPVFRIYSANIRQAGVGGVPGGSEPSNDERHGDPGRPKVERP